MNEKAILAETKKAIDFWMDGQTYDEAAFYSHILTIIKDAIGDGAKHKEQMERMLFKTSEMFETEAMINSGHKSMAKDLKDQKKELFDKVKYLTTMGGYSIERFKKVHVQNTIFK